jgi:L-fucose isomerase-like protein
VAKGPQDVTLIYAAGGRGLEALTTPDKWNLMFLRHDPGPVYLWYEIVHPRFLRKTVDDYGQPGWDVDDVVVDKHSDLLWRLRALSGLKNTLGKKIICIGGAGGWGVGGKTAPARTKELWKMELVDFPYKELAPRIQAARKNETLVKACQAAAGKYLRNVAALRTTREFVNNAFVLTEVFKDILDEAKTDAITVHHCMGTIMPMSETTACMTLSLLNDDNYLAFCESDFVVIPSGVLLHYISGLPVFLNDPTYPHDGVVTLAHCTAPRRMDGTRLDTVKILTHFESDYGAAPKVEMRLGQRCTTLVPDFASKKWVGFDGTIAANPFLDICRSQVDVRIHGDAAALLREMKGFHWMMSYGDYLRECGYALKKVGVEMLNVSAKV